MIRYYQIENFKSLRYFSTPLEHLNLFLGLNGSGKSSVIQSLLLLRQSYSHNNRSSLDSLVLNNHLVSLGSAKDVMCQTSEDNFIRFVVGFERDRVVDVSFSYDSEGSSYLTRLHTGKNDFLDNSLFGDSFFALAADHIGPRKQYDFSRWDMGGSDYLGIHGEYVVPYLAYNGDSYRVPEKLCNEHGKSELLLDQVSAWISTVSPGARIKTQLSELEQTVKLLVSFEGDRLISPDFSPVNVGFGISYVLPLVVELLISQKDSLILIENPESHLHPKGQVAMAQLIAKAAANGAQVICETHSDHLINGIRVAVKNDMIACKDVTLSYFDKNEKQETIVDGIKMDSNGSIDHYPYGFLDEWGEQLSKLL